MQIDFRYATHFQTGCDLRSAFRQASAGMLVLVVDGRAMRPASELEGVFPFSKDSVILALRPLGQHDNAVLEHHIREASPLSLRRQIGFLSSGKVISLVDDDGEKCAVARNVGTKTSLALYVTGSAEYRRSLLAIGGREFETRDVGEFPPPAGSAGSSWNSSESYYPR